MITACFYKEQNKFTGFKVTGHADFSEHGSDIVCAGVTSAVQMTVNCITEILEISSTFIINESKISIETLDIKNEMLQVLYKGLYLQLSLIKEDYEDNIKILVMEV